LSTVLLIIHVFVTILLIGVVLIQRSEGGGLGIGTSQGMGSFMSGRGTANLLTRTTAILAAIFMALSMALAVLNKGGGGAQRSILDTVPALPVPAPVPGTAPAPSAPVGTAPSGTAPSGTAPAGTGPSAPAGAAPSAPAGAAPSTPAGSAPATTTPSPTAPAPTSPSPASPSPASPSPSGSTAPAAKVPAPAAPSSPSAPTN
jgi:preprotein translocase subunit SecG